MNTEGLTEVAVNEALPVDEPVVEATPAAAPAARPTPAFLRNERRSTISPCGCV